MINTSSWLKVAEACVRLAAPEHNSKGLLRTEAVAQKYQRRLEQRVEKRSEVLSAEELEAMKGRLAEAAKNPYSLRTRATAKFVGPTVLVMIAPLIPLIQVLFGRDSTEEQKAVARDELLKRLGQGATTLATGGQVDLNNLDSVMAALERASQAAQVDPRSGQAPIDPRISAATDLLRSYYGDPIQGRDAYDSTDSRQDRMLALVMDELSRLQFGQQLANPGARMPNLGYPTAAIGASPATVPSAPVDTWTQVGSADPTIGSRASTGSSPSSP